VIASDDNRLIALAAGGTGGHMFPAEALAQELKRRGRQVLLVTDARGARYAESFPADEKFQISAATASVGGLAAKGLAAVSVAQGVFTALGKYRKLKPVAAIGFGGYPSFPAMKAASLCGIPYGVHEQNGVLGRANRMLVKGAAFTAHAFPVLEKAPAGIHAVEVGNPVRDAVAALSDATFAPINDGDINLLIFGGSQGASIFSTAPVKAIAGLPEGMRRRLVVVHQAREDDIEQVKAGYAAAGVRAEIAPFFADLPARMAAAHLIISRAGASTVTELSAIGRGAILVPLAIAMDDHQSGNAEVLARDISGASAAIVLPESGFNEISLRQALEGLFAEPARLQLMAEAAKGRVRSGAASALADLVEGLCESGPMRQSGAV
jgi:UDP-N-acetylglucosamine--N-acetylmuramyl-(pentapeptide) pyrophosphoryl-undecaprenol N-acetylglucosamine transferase